MDTLFIYKLLLAAPLGFATGFVLARRYRMTVALPAAVATCAAWLVFGTLLDTRSLDAGCSNDCNSASWAVLILGPINAVLFAIGLAPGLLVGRVTTSV